MELILEVLTRGGRRGRDAAIESEGYAMSVAALRVEAWRGGDVRRPEPFAADDLRDVGPGS